MCLLPCRACAAWPPYIFPPTHPSALQVVKYLCEMINKKDKKANVKPFMAKNYLWVFVNCLIENPAFDSQASGAPCRAMLWVWCAGTQGHWQQAAA